MPELFDLTRLDPKTVAARTRYFDWGSQPTIQKRYPAFMYRYPLESDIPEFSTIRLARCITDRTHVGGKPYNRFNVPSAGNLHPVELYVQVRGVKGVLSGIYHVDALEGSLVLIAEVEDDGVEPVLGLESRYRGLIFIVSVVPFRSEWKYDERAWRYCWLDAGHQMGALASASSVTGRPMTFLSDFIPADVDRLLGFGSDEFCVGAAICAEATGRRVKKLKEHAPYVQPTDYATMASPVRDAMKTHSTKPVITPFVSPGHGVTASTVTARRSARTFESRPLRPDECKTVWRTLADAPLQIVVVVHRCEGLQPGLYDAAGNRMLACETDETAGLLVGQQIATEASMTIVCLSDSEPARDMLHAGALVHALYLAGNGGGIGVSGIGAFYDDHLRAFLNTEKEIAYVAVVGPLEL